MEMNKENNTPFKAEDVNWDELAAIGILKDELEMAGELDTLLSGEKKAGWSGFSGISMFFIQF